MIAPQLSQLGASVWKLANCSARLAKLPPLRSTFIDAGPFQTAPRSTATDFGALPFWPAAASWRPLPGDWRLGRPILARLAGSPAFLAASLGSASASSAAGVAAGASSAAVALGLAIAGQERDAQPAEDVVDNALGDADVGVLGVPHRLEAGVRELVHIHFQRHAVLQAHRHRRAEAIHQAADRCSLPWPW